jgi:hypothetical protein
MRGGGVVVTGHTAPVSPQATQPGCVASHASR